MTVASLTVLVLLGLEAGPGADPSALVAKLGSSRYADREAAATALEKLSSEALPALRLAVNSHDQEVRSRAQALLEKIDSDLMTRPTMVKLDFDDQPLAVVLKAVSEQCGITLVLEPEGLTVGKPLKVTLHEPGPVPFWKAVDLLCTAAGLQHNAGSPMAGPGRGQVFRLYPGSGATVPTSDSGPFRASLNSIHLHRDRMLAQGGGGAFPGAIQVLRPGPAAVVGQFQQLQMPGQPQPSTSEQFYAQMQVVTEPRLMLTQTHELKLVEALDELGQSLLPQPVGGQAQHSSGYYGYSPSPLLQMPISLRRPEQAGKTIKKLKGVLPVTVSARKPDPLIVPLKTDSFNKAFRGADVSVTVHDVTVDANNQRTSVEFSVRPMGSQGDAVPAPGLAQLDLGGFRAPNPAQNQIEIADAQGRLLQGYPSNTQMQPDVVRMTLSLIPMPGAGAPAELRYYSLSQARTEVAFEFTDIPMP